MKKWILSLLTAGTAIAAHAQIGYTLSTLTDPYTPLTSGTAFLGTDIWSDSSLFTTPLPFTYHIGGTPVTQFYMIGGDFNGVITDTAANASINAFILMDGTLEDRGQVSGVQSLSPARYQVDGVAPNRIFKAEIASAGFSAEYDAHETMNDSVSFQVWLYEGAEVFEMRYGAAKISDSSNYFNTLYTGLPFIGYLKNANQASQSFDGFYILAGSTANPVIDSLVYPTHIPNPISGFPSSGTVYRFTPSNTTAGISVAALMKALTIAPVPCTDILNVTYQQAGTATYSILAANGALIASGTLSQGSNPLNIATLPTGTYMLEVKNSTTAAASRFVKM